MLVARHAHPLDRPLAARYAMTHASMPLRQPRALVGRDREMETLGQHLTEMQAGHGSIVLIGGEAGIGKTTLVESFTRRSDVLTLTGHCYDLAATPPFGPWVELIESYPNNTGLPDLPNELVFDRDLAGISSRTALFQRLRAFIVQVSAARPLMLVLEDLHWADDASLDLLRYVARSIAGHRILLIATYRDDEITRRHPLFQSVPLLVRESGANRLPVARLGQRDLEQLTTGRYTLVPTDRDRLVAFLLRMTDGNPLYATEMLRSLEEEGRLHPDRDGWRLIDLDRTQIPSLVDQVIGARLTRLNDETQRLLDIAAVIGEDVPLDLWSTVSEADDADLASAIEDAVAAGLLVHTDGGHGVRFTHAIIREAVYQRQILLRHRPWHQRVASALIVSPQSDPDVVVHHLERANDPRLVDWLIRSGERAQHRFVWPVAGKQFDRAQEILANDPDRTGERGWLLFRIALLVRNADSPTSVARLEEAERIAVELDDRLLAQLARAHKGLVLCYGRDVRQGLTDLEAGTLALERLDEPDADRLREVTASWEFILGVQGRATLAQWLAIVGRFKQARTILEDWDETEREASADAHRAAGIIAANLGEPDLARRRFRRSRSVYEARGDRFQAGDDAFHELLDVQIPYAADQVEERRQLVRLAQALWTDPIEQAQSAWVRDSVEAVEAFLSGEWSRAAGLFSRQRDHAWFVNSQFIGWWLTLVRLRGESVNAWPVIDSALPDGPATEPGARGYAVLTSVYLVAAELALDASDLPRSHAWLEAHDQLLAWSGAVRGRAENHLVWARYYRMAGNPSAAQEHSRQALTHASDPRQPLALIAAERMLGTLACDEGHRADANLHLSAALRLADTCAAPFERALTLLELAELRMMSGDGDEARRLLVAARSICEPLGAVPTLKRLDGLEVEFAQRRHTNDLPAGLSQREAEVLRLVAQGLTDAEVAERLFIARRTVNTHLTAIYTKLGVNSRVAATRFAIEHDLA